MAFNNSITTLASGSDTDGWQQGVLVVVQEFLENLFGDFDTDALASIKARVAPRMPQVNGESLPWVYYYLLRPQIRSKGGNTAGKKFIKATVAIEIYTWRQQDNKPEYEAELGLLRLGDVLYNGYETHFADFGAAGLRWLELQGPIPFYDEEAYGARYLLSGTLERSE